MKISVQLRGIFSWKLIIVPAILYTSVRQEEMIIFVLFFIYFPMTHQYSVCSIANIHMWHTIFCDNIY